MTDNHPATCIWTFVGRHQWFTECTGPRLIGYYTLTKQVLSMTFCLHCAKRVLVTELTRQLILQNYYA